MGNLLVVAVCMDLHSARDRWRNDCTVVGFMVAYDHIFRFVLTPTRPIHTAPPPCGRTFPWHIVLEVLQ